jgi:hypothetical protein
MFRSRVVDPRDLKRNNRLYSKDNKSSRAKVAIIFVHFRFSVISFCVVATIKNVFVLKTYSYFLIVAKHARKLN